MSSHALLIPTERSKSLYVGYDRFEGLGSVACHNTNMAVEVDRICLSDTPIAGTIGQLLFHGHPVDTS